jgi:hypothetical protein
MLDDITEFKGILDTVKVLAEAEKSNEVLDILRRSEISIQQTNYDNWNGGIYYYTIYIKVDVNKFIELRTNLQEWENLLLENFTLPVRHLENEGIAKVTIIPKTSTITSPELNPHIVLTPSELKRQELLISFLEKSSEDELIEEILTPLFRQLGFHRITVAGHKDKALEYGKDIWMKYTLPTQHVLYFGIQVKKGKLDSAGVTNSSNANIAEVYQQVLMMLGHEIFDPEIGKRVLVDHAFIATGGEITKAARNWLGGKLDASKRSQILFMDREDILNLFIVNNIPLPKAALPIEKPLDDDLPF